MLRVPHRFSNLHRLAFVGVVAAGLGLSASGTASAEFDLGVAADYVVLQYNGTGSGQTQFSISGGDTIINGSLGLADNTKGNFAFSAGNVSGPLFMSLVNTSVNNTGGITVNKDASSTADLQQAVTDAQNASLTAVGLTATQTVLTPVTGARIFTGIGGVNVVNLTQGINLSGIISIQGTSSDTFIFNVFNSMSAGNGGDVILSGGITPSQILWNYRGNSNVSLSGNLSDIWQGTVLAPNAQIAASGRTFAGALIADDNISITGIPLFNYAGFAPVPAVPEPPGRVMWGSAALFGLIIAGWHRRRHR